MTELSLIIAEAAREASAAGASDWPSLRKAMMCALDRSTSPDDLVQAAATAGAPGRLELLEARNRRIHEIARLPRYRHLASRNRALSEAISRDLAEYSENRHQVEIPNHDPDRLFHRIISDGSAIIGGSGRTIGWNAIYQILMV